jgi:hypothetical protein
MTANHAISNHAVAQTQNDMRAATAVEAKPDAAREA